MPVVRRATAGRDVHVDQAVATVGIVALVLAVDSGSLNDILRSAE
jgi:hypothetical protein